MVDFVTTDEFVYLVMDMVGLVWAGMDVVGGMHAGQSQGLGGMSGDAGVLPVCEMIQ